MKRTSTPMTSAVALMSVFGLGICFIIVGAISVEYQKALNIQNIGDLTFTLFLTSAIVQLAVGPAVDKFGYKPIAGVGFMVTSASMLLLESAASTGAAIGACVLLGVGAMCLNTVGNTLIPVVLFDGQDPARASNFGNGFFGLGLVITPLLFSLVAWQTALFLLAGLFFLLLLVSLATSFPSVSTGFQLSMAFRLLGRGAVLLSGLALFCYMSLESSLSTWAKPYMTEILGGADDAGAVYGAGLVLSLFGVAMTVGRFLTSVVKNLTAIGVRVIAGAALASIVAIGVMMLTSAPAVATVAVVVAGFAFAPIFPTVVGVTFAKFAPSLYGSIFGIIFSIGLLGATFVPKIVGNLSEGATVQRSLLIVLGMAVALLVVSLFLRTRPRTAEKVSRT
ncbi:MAG: sugar MFS transporter [Vicinamibacterales bacterium]